MCLMWLVRSQVEYVGGARAAHTADVRVRRAVPAGFVGVRGGGCGAARDARTRLPSMRRMGGRNRVDIHGCRELSSDLL